MIRSAGFIAALFLLAVVPRAGAAEPETAAFSDEDLAFFEKKVRPLLVQRCYECHSSKSEKLRGGLVLDSRAGALRGGDTGAAIIPGNVDDSAFIKALRYDDVIQMPPDG